MLFCVGQDFILRPICNRQGGLKSRRRLKAAESLPHSETQVD